MLVMLCKHSVESQDITINRDEIMINHDEITIRRMWLRPHCNMKLASLPLPLAPLLLPFVCHLVPTSSYPSTVCYYAKISSGLESQLSSLTGHNG